MDGFYQLATIIGMMESQMVQIVFFCIWVLFHILVFMWPQIVSKYSFLIRRILSNISLIMFSEQL